MADLANHAEFREELPAADTERLVTENDASTIKFLLRAAQFSQQKSVGYCGVGEGLRGRVARSLRGKFSLEQRELRGLLEPRQKALHLVNLCFLL